MSLDCKNNHNDGRGRPVVGPKRLTSCCKATTALDLSFCLVVQLFVNCECGCVCLRLICAELSSLLHFLVIQNQTPFDWGQFVRQLEVKYLLATYLDPLLYFAFSTCGNRVPKHFTC